MLVAGCLTAIAVGAAVFLAQQRGDDDRGSGAGIERIGASVLGKPTDFKTSLERRLDDENYGCSDLGELDRHACLIFQSALGIEPDTESARFDMFVAIETMNVVSVLVSSARYSLIKRLQGEHFRSPGRDAELCLDAGYGICGNHAATAIALLERLGIDARAVQFFYSKEGQRLSHIAIEADIEGWRYFDTTWGAFWFSDPTDPTGSIMSAEKILTSDQPRVMANQAQSWSLKANDRYDIFEYFTLDPSVVYGYDSGTVRISNPAPTIGERFDFAHLPNYVGDNRDDGRFEGVVFSFSPIEDWSVLAIEAKAIGGCKSKDSRICVNETCENIDSHKKSYSIKAEDASRLYLTSSDDSSCYIVFDTVRVERAAGGAAEVPSGTTDLQRMGSASSRGISSVH